MKFTVVTPCRNAEALVGDTVRSVCRQTILVSNSVHELEYILVDGASTDQTVKTAQTAWVEHPRATMTVISEPDRGMYDALVKGFLKSSGDIVSYLNAGDYYSDDCLNVVGSAFSSEQIEWLTGMWVVYTTTGGIFGAKVPWRYSRDLIRRGYHGIRGAGSSIQQESTFWRRSLAGEVSMSALAEFRYAGDLFLWSRFAVHHELYVVAAHLGGFRYHGNHLSDAQDLYRGEAMLFIEQRRMGGAFRGFLHKVAGSIPSTVRIRLGLGKRLVTYEINSATWRLH